MKANARMAALGGVMLVVLGMTVTRLVGGAPPARGTAALKLRGAAGAGLRLELESGSNGVVYALQTTTNLSQWQTLMATRGKVGVTNVLGEVRATNVASFYRVVESMAPQDTNAPGWGLRGVQGRLVSAGGSRLMVQWNAATDNVGVAEYRLVVNGQVLTNVSALRQQQELALEGSRKGELRIQAVDASGNATALMSLSPPVGDKPVVLVDDSGRVYGFQRQGDGTFSEGKLITNFGILTRGLVLGDFDRDGYVDLVAGHGGNNRVNVYFFKGHGDGTYEAGVALLNPAGSGGWLADGAVGDFDADGYLDFAINGTDRYVFFYWGNGDGTFSVESRDVGGAGRGLAAGDFNEDGRIDLARAHCCDGRTRLFLSNGDRTFTETNQVGQFESDPYGVAAGDFDEDGHLDLLVNGGGSGSVVFYKGLGDGSFTNLGPSGPWSGLDINTYSGLDGFDYDGDGHVDLVMSAANGRGYYWGGNGDGSFASNAVTLISGISAAFGVAAPPRPARVEVSVAPVEPVIGLHGKVDFTAEGTGVKGGDAIWWTFGDVGTNTLAWLFDTNAPAMGPAVSHQYDKEGRFVARLLHRDASGVWSSRGTWVRVKAEPPVARAGGPYELGEKAASQLVWTATVDGSGSSDDYGIASYIWDFGDGTVVTNSVPTATHGWNGVGPWTVGLRVVDVAGQSAAATTTVTFTAGAAPVAAITGKAEVDEESARNGVWSTGFNGNQSTDDVGVWKYDWMFGDGKTGSGRSVNTTYGAVGTYTVVLTVTDHAGQTNTTSMEVRVKANGLPVPAIAGPTLLGPSVATNGMWWGAWSGKGSSDDTGIYRYQWTFGDGGTAEGAETSHQYKLAGLYPLVLKVTDHGNQSVTVTQNVAVVAGAEPVARIDAANLSPEGAEPIGLIGHNSSGDHGLSSYQWLLPPQAYGFAGRALDADRWYGPRARQEDKILLNGDGSWGRNFLYSVGPRLARGGAFQGRIDTGTGGNVAMVGVRNTDNGSGAYDRLIHAFYFNNGSVQISESSPVATVTNYTPGNAYEFRIQTKVPAGAVYYLRNAGAGEEWVKVYESNNRSEGAFGVGMDVLSGGFGFDDFVLEGMYLPYADVTTGVFPGGEVTLQVVDHTWQTNTAKVRVTPVVGAVPVAVISGPTNGLAGAELAFDGYRSSDDHAVASYTWEFGDGSPLAFGPAVSHSFAGAGTYTNTLTVMDYAGQASVARLVTQITGARQLVAVPWKIVSGVQQPHEIYAGKATTLKAVARGVPLPFTVVWDYGDGTGTVTNVVTQSGPVYNLEATHAYAGGEGTPFYGTVTVTLTNGVVLRDTYQMLMRPKTLDVEMKVAIDEGLWRIHKTMTYYDIDANTRGGYWVDNGFGVNATASAVQALAINGHLMTDDGSVDPYVETVQRGMNYLLNSINTIGIGVQPYGDPDGNRNGIALTAAGGRPCYETGPLMDALVAAGRPELVAGTGGANVRGRLFRDIMQDLVDVYAWGQDDYPTGGGWRYGWKDFPDNSASQWGAIGMIAAEHYWGVKAPEWVKVRNTNWVETSRGNGFGYTGAGCNDACAATTPSGLVQLAFAGVTTSHELWQHGENFLANNWGMVLGQNNVYANYAIAKALRLAQPQAVERFAANGMDWFRDPASGLARFTIDHQQANGAWTSGRWVEERLATSWSVIILSSSLFQRGPVAVLSAKPNPSAVGYPVVFDGRSSYHQHPAYTIVDYRWIFDGSRGLDFEHPDATGPVATNVFGALGTNVVWLQVRDNGTPALSDTASLTIQTSIPPFPPTADAGGPYIATVGEDVHVDGSGSFVVDAEAGNYLQSWDWELDFEMPLDFADEVSGEKTVIPGGFGSAGQHRLGLRVRNANSLVYTNVSVPDMTADAFTLVYVYDRVIPDLKARPKGNKGQLTWTKAGDYGVVVRSRVGPDRGFEEIGRTESGYATYLDTNVAYNVDYYYRVYAYQNGRPDPLGLSDPVFLHSTPRNFEHGAPFFASTPDRYAKVGQRYRVTLDGRSPSNDPFEYMLLSGPTNFVVEPATGVVNFTPNEDQLGTQPVSIAVTNQYGRDVLSFSIVVFPTTIAPPTASANGPYRALAGEAIAFSSEGTIDPGQRVLKYVWNFGDGTLSTNPNPTHVYGGVGDYLVTLIVNNGFGGTASSRTQARVIRPNRTPTAAIRGGPTFHVRLGEAVGIDGSASADLDPGSLQFTWTWGDGRTEVTATNRLMHTYTTPGDYQGQLRVTDPEGAESTADFTVEVGPANQAPTAAFTVTPGGLNATIVATFDATTSSDPEGDALAFEWDFGDRTRTTGSIVTHAYRAVGDYPVVLRVTDDHGASVVSTQIVQVVNAPPVFRSTPPLMVRAEKPYQYIPALGDLDGDPFSFELVQAPPTMSIDPQTGQLDWLPGEGDVGANPVVIRATDPRGGVTDQSFTLVVTTPSGPQLDLTPTHIATTNLVVDAQTLALSGTVAVFVRDLGADNVPVPFTVSVFVSPSFSGKFDTNTDRVIAQGSIPAGLATNQVAWIEMPVKGTGVFKDNPVYAFVDSGNVVPEYDEANNIRRSGFDVDTNVPPVVDLTASQLNVDRTGLPGVAGLTARLGNAGLVAVGTNVAVAFYDGDPAGGGTLIGVARSSVALEPGRFEDLAVAWANPAITNHTVYVVADDDGQGAGAFVEITRTNNTFSAEVDLSKVEPPVAIVGPPQTVDIGDAVGVNGAGSQDPQGKALTYRWSVVSFPLGSRAVLNNATTPEAWFVTDVVGKYVVELVVSNGVLDSEPVQATVNAVDPAAIQPPRIISAPSFQTMATVRYQYQIQTTNPDGAPLTYKLPQAPAGMTMNTNTGLVQWTPADPGTYFVRVDVVDNRGAGSYQTYTLTVVPFALQPPTFVSEPLLTARPGVGYVYAAKATSPSGFNLSYALTAKPTGMTINAGNGEIRWTPTTAQVGASTVTVTASDGKGGTATQTYNLVVLNAGADGPVVRPIPSQTIVEPGTFATIRLDSYVADPAYRPNQMTWTASGAKQFEVAIDSNRVATVTYAAGTLASERITFLVTNPDGRAAYSAPVFTVRGEDHPPMAAIASLPADRTTTITAGLLELNGTADDPDAVDAVQYRLGLYDGQGQRVADVTPAPLNAAGWHEGRVATGGSLGKADFTLVRNGTYTLVLEVQGGTGTAVAQVPIALDSNLKIGQVRFSQQDLIIPVRGTGLRVVRTYDSLDPRAADFGYSWSYSVYDLNLTINEDRAEEIDLFEDKFSLRTGGGRDVTVDLPDSGRRVTFTYSLVPGGLFKLQAIWTAPKGVRASLVPMGSPYLVSLFNQLTYWEAAGIEVDLDQFDFPGFILTTEDGTRYEIKREDLGEHLLWGSGAGLGTYVHAYGDAYISRILEPNGDRTEFVRDGVSLKSIEKYDGGNTRLKSVKIQRDAQRRINAIYSPDQLDAGGNPVGPATVTYAYDEAGNLGTVGKLVAGGDPAAPVYANTRYSYTHPRFPHLLTRITDPRGIVTLEVEFDDRGRIVGTVDAFGNRTSIEHNLDARTETVFDRSGQPTVFAYDENGNILAETDALGQTRRYAYDTAGRLVTFTDPLGHVTRREYDADGRVTVLTDPLGNTTRYAYDANGNQVSSTDPMGQTTTYVYDANNQRIATIDPLGRRTESRYDEAGNLTTSINAAGQVTARYAYDATGNLRSLADVAGIGRDFAYDGRGNLTGTTVAWVNPDNTNDVRNVGLLAAYDDASQLTNLVDGQGLITSTAYDRVGRVSMSKDPQGRVTAHAYDARGNRVNTTYADGAQSESVYDENNRLVVSVDRHAAGQPANGSRFVYDAVGRLVRTERWADVRVNLVAVTNNQEVIVTANFASAGALLAATETEYDAAGRPVARKDAAGQVTRYEYDAAGRNTAIVDPLGQRTEFAFDAAGHLTRKKDPLGRETNFLYDAAGRRVRTVYPDGANTRTSYDLLDNVVEQLDETGVARNFETDARGQLVATILPAVADPDQGGAPVRPRFETEYDDYGNPRVIRDPKGQATRMAYDEAQRLVARTLPLGQTERMTYDGLGRLQRHTDFNGQATAFTYDALGRIARKEFFGAGSNAPSARVQLTYDALGQVRKVTDEHGDSEYTYDRDGRLVEARSPEGTIGYEYDAATGWRSRVVTAFGDTRYAYDELGRLQRVTVVRRNGVDLPQPEVTEYSYDAIGNRSSVRLPNGLVTRYTYDARSRLTLLTHENASSNVFASYAYSVNARGLRTAVNEVRGGGADQATVASSFTYDAAGRLATEVYSPSDTNHPGYSARYAYDLAGNRIERTVQIGRESIVTSYTYDRNNRLLMESNHIATVTPGLAAGTIRIPGGAAGGSLAYRPQAAAWCYHAVKATPYLLLSAALVPFAGWLRRRRPAWAVFTLELRPDRALFPRCLSALLAMIMALTSFDFRAVAQSADLYAAVSLQDWGTGDTVTVHEYDDNGSLVRSVTTGPEARTVTYRYNLERRLVATTTTRSTGGHELVNISERTYDHAGTMVGNLVRTLVDGGETSRHNAVYLIDYLNPIGLPRVLEEYASAGASPRISYTLGDEVLSQTVDDGSGAVTEHLLYDGQGSTRQLVDGSGNVTAGYGYDAFGVMLGGQPTAERPARARVLYAGQPYDTATRHYQMGDRNYDPGAGRFTSQDPAAGSMMEPESLHKYAYAHNDPVNFTDPSGHGDFSLAGVMAGVTIAATILSIAAPIVGGIIASVRAGLSWTKVLQHLGEYNTWASAVAALTIGAAGGIAIQQFLLKFGKKFATRAIPVVGLIFALVGLYQSIKLAYQIATAELPPADAEKYIAVMIAGSILVAVLGIASRTGLFKSWASKGSEKDADFWKLSAEDQAFYEKGQSALPKKVLDALTNQGSSVTDTVNRGRELAQNNALVQMWNGAKAAFELFANSARNVAPWNWNKPPAFGVAQWMGTGPTPLDRFVLIDNLTTVIASMVSALESLGDDLYAWVSRR